MADSHFKSRFDRAATPTDARRLMDALGNGASTDLLTEGTVNKFFTNERAQDALALAFAAGVQTNITVTYNDGTDSFDFTVTGGTGDVVGPASAVNNRVAFFNGTTGKLIKDSGLALSGSNTGDQTIALTGDVTGTGTGSFAATIAAAAVTNAKLANMAAHTLKANITAGAAAPVDSSLSAVLDAEIGSTRGKIAVRGASAWQSLALGSTGQAVVSDGTDAKWGAVGAAAGGGYATLGVATAGSSVTSLTISGLDLSLYKAFKVYFALKDAAATGTGTISLFYNSDTTTTDYNEQALTLSGATVTAARANDARMCNLEVNRYTTGFIEIEKDVNGRASALIFSNRDGSTGIVWQSAMHVWSTNFANVTGITISSSIASQLAAGSYFAVYGITI